MTGDVGENSEVVGYEEQQWLESRRAENSGESSDNESLLVGADMETLFNMRNEGFGGLSSAPEESGEDLFWSDSDEH